MLLEAPNGIACEEIARDLGAAPLALGCPQGSCLAIAGKISAPGPLASLGLTDDEQVAYRALFGGPGLTAREVASALGWAPGHAETILEHLERKALTVRSCDEPPSFSAAPPDLALGALIRRRHDDLDEARQLTERLTQEYREAHRRVAPLDVVELLEAPMAVERHEQMIRSARSEILVFLCDRDTQRRQSMQEIELERLAKGVAVKVLRSGNALDVDGELSWMEAAIHAGEEARVVPELPFPLLVVDREIALVESPAGAVVVRSAILVDGLTSLFDAIWDRGVPVSKQEPAPSRGRLGAGNSPSAEDRQILSLIAAGLKDEAIAYRLDLSPRTVRRRIARLMRVLGADNRFQAGYQVARRGWL